MAAMKRRDFLEAIAGGAAAGTISGCARSRTNARQQDTKPRIRPNIVFLIADDQRHDTLKALGNDFIETPNLDRLVGQGTAFTHAYIMGGTQGAICICSRAMYLTGRSLWRAPNDCAGVPLWPQLLREAGYVTYGVGKWHNGPASYARCFSGGAEIFFGGMSDQWRVPVSDFDPSGRYPRQARRTAERFSSELFTDAAVSFLERYGGDRPFVLYVSYTAPHDPRTPPKEYLNKYPPEKVPLPPNFMPEHPFDNGDLRVRDEMLAPHPRTPEVVRRHLADYYAMITHLDGQIGRVLAALDKTGLADNTLVIFAGDNGLAVGQHGLFGKQNLYEHSVRVPLVIRGPGVPAGERRDTLVYLHDVCPTICQAAAVPAPEGTEGQSLLPLAADNSLGGRDSIFAAYRQFQRMVRQGRHKLIRYAVAGQRRTQLFDLEADPWEMHDLAGDPAHAATVAGLEALLRKYQVETGDPLLA